MHSLVRLMHSAPLLTATNDFAAMAGILWVSVLSLGLEALARNESLQVSLNAQSWELSVGSSDLLVPHDVDRFLVTYYSAG